MSPEHKIAARYVEYETDRGAPSDLTYVEDYASGPIADGQYMDLRRTVGGRTTLQWLTASKGHSYGARGIDATLVYDHETAPTKGWQHAGYTCKDGADSGEFSLKELHDFDPATLEKQYCDNDNN